MRYLNKVNSRHGIRIPTTSGCQHCGEKHILMLQLCLLNIFFNISTTQHIVYFFLDILPFTCLPILEGDIISMTNYDYDKHFSISAGGEYGGLCDAKVRGKYQKNEKKKCLIVI